MPSEERYKSSGSGMYADARDRRREADGASTRA
jgi:hypothetical protein